MTRNIVPRESGEGAVGTVGKPWGTLRANALSLYDLPIYADNAAALAGGLIEGMCYRTSAGVVMVTYSA